MVSLSVSGRKTYQDRNSASEEYTPTTIQTKLETLLLYNISLYEAQYIIVQIYYSLKIDT